MTLTIYHNPHCSKSRKVLELIESKGFRPKIIPYLSEPPDAATVLRLAAMLGVRVVDLLRPDADDFAALTRNGALLDDLGLAAGLANYPAVLQRPIVVNEDTGKAVIGRPPENIHELLSS